MIKKTGLLLLLCVGGLLVGCHRGEDNRNWGSSGGSTSPGYSGSSGSQGGSQGSSGSQSGSQGSTSESSTNNPSSSNP